MSEFFNAIDAQDEENIRRQAMMICDALYNKKAQDIMAIHVGDRTIIADWFVVCSGRATAQVKALCDEIEEKAEGMGLSVRRIEGYSEGRWIVIDHMPCSRRLPATACLLLCERNTATSLFIAYQII